MGRGRAKAKQTKVARDLKYNAQDMDLDRLAKELHGEIDTTSRKDDDDPFAEGNYIHVRETNTVRSFTSYLRTIICI